MISCLNNVYQELPTTTVPEIRKKNSAEYGFCKVKDGCISGRVCKYNKPP